MSRAAEVGSTLHVLTLTPFFPSDQNEVSGCFIAEPIEQLKQFGVDSSVIAASPIYHPRKRASSTAAAEWVRYPQVPGNLGLSSAGKLLYARLLGRVRKLHDAKPIDVIHAHAALPCGHAAALLSKRLNIPFVITLHGLDVFNTCFLSGRPAAWRRKVSVDVYRAARTVICISGKVQEILKSRNAGGDLQHRRVQRCKSESVFAESRRGGKARSGDSDGRQPAAQQRPRTGFASARKSPDPPFPGFAAASSEKGRIAPSLKHWRATWASVSKFSLSAVRAGPKWRRPCDAAPYSCCPAATRAWDACTWKPCPAARR